MATFLKKLTGITGVVIMATVIIALPALAVVLPDATTRYATYITATTAQLNGYVDDDGGEACDIRFNYYMEGGAWGDNVTAWVAGYETGDTAFVSVAGLTTDKIYYYRVEIRNSIGTVTGDSVAFSAYAAPAMPRTWFSGPNAAQWNATFIGGVAGIAASSLEMPVETFYLVLALIICLALGIGTLIVSKRLLPAVIVLAGSMALCSLAGLMPMFFMAFSLILVIGAIKMGHPREE